MPNARCYNHLMTTQPIPPVIDLVALVEHINNLVNQPRTGASAVVTHALLAQVVRRLHEYGHPDVELVGAVSTTPPTKNGSSPHKILFEGTALALRQGGHVVGPCGARDLSGLTATSRLRAKEEMGHNELPITTGFVYGQLAMGRAPLLAPTRQAEINAMVDKMFLGWAVSEPAAERPKARM